MTLKTADQYMRMNFINRVKDTVFGIIIPAGFAACTLLIIGSCSNPSQPKTEPIFPVSTWQLDIPEPSGICFGRDYETLWIVSDAPHNKVYQTDLEGKVLLTLDVDGDDLEGIAYDHNKNLLWLAEEQLQEIVKISIDGQELGRYPVPVEKSGANGIEGVALNEPSGFWVVNEKNPVLLAKLDSYGNSLAVYDDALAEDYSDVCYDAATGWLWIISDESRLLIAWSPEYGVIERYSLSFDKAEGVAVHPETGHIFIVNDLESMLSLFDPEEK